jgi:hypothetical protein
MTYPVSNQKNYGTETDYNSGYEEEGVDGDFDAEMQDGEWATDDIESEFIDETEEAGDPSCPTTSLADQEAYVECALEMLENTEFADEAQKESFKKELEDQLRRLGMAHFLEGDALASTLEDVGAAVSKIECDIRAAVQDAADANSPDNPTGQIQSLQKQADDLLAAGKITQTTYDDIVKDLTDAQSNLDLPNAGEAQIAQAEELIASAQEKLNMASSSPAKAQALAAQLGVSVEDVVAAAASQAPPVDLDADPIVVNDSLMKMLQSLNVPSSEDLGSLMTLQQQYVKEVGDWSVRGDAETVIWQGDSEMIPNLEIYQKLGALYNGTAPVCVQMDQTKDKMEAALGGALTALGATVSDGSVPGRITVNGTEYDFVNEDVGSLKLDTIFNELTDPYFSPAPRNTEASGYHGDNAATNFREHDGQYWDAVGADYPKTKFSKDG